MNSIARLLFEDISQYLSFFAVIFITFFVMIFPIYKSLRKNEWKWFIFLVVSVVMIFLFIPLYLGIIPHVVYLITHYKVVEKKNINKNG